ncbi:MAG: DNA topoisomerase III, partial [Clostridiales bacterium]
MSRFYSITHKDKFSVGRVQTPSLSMIYRRDMEINNFKKETYYTLDIITDDITLSSDRLNDVDLAKQLKSDVPRKVEIFDFIEKEKITKPDALFDLTTLQRECNKYFSYSAKQTLDYAQSLYEKKLITYPRTDSRYLSDDMKESTMKLLRDVKVDNENFNKIFNSSKVTDHHSIIPTLLSLDFDINSLPSSERKVFELIRDKFYAAVSSNLIENTTKIIVKVNDYEFTTNGKVVIKKGFTEHLSKYTKNKKDVALLKLNKGDQIDVKEVKIIKKYTKPPKPYTENTLLKAMEVAGNENLEKGIEVERKGLGTPATRAGIIENLLSRELIKRDKKNLLIT